MLKMDKGLGMEEEPTVCASVREGRQGWEAEGREKPTPAHFFENTVNLPRSRSTKYKLDVTHCIMCRELRIFEGKLRRLEMRVRSINLLNYFSEKLFDGPRNARK